MCINNCCKKYGSIYIIKNSINYKVYIGQTTMSIDERFKSHIKNSTIKNRTYKLYNAMKKYGKNNFYIEILEENVPYIQLNDKEIYYIDKYNSYKYGYNSTKGGDGKIINKDYDELEIIKMYNNGLSMSIIGNKYDVSSSTISRVLNKNKITTRENGNKYKQFNEEEFRKKWYSNYTIKDMAIYFKCDTKTIQRNAKRLNLGKKNKNIYRDTHGRFKKVLYNNFEGGDK